MNRLAVGAIAGALGIASAFTVYQSIKQTGRVEGQFKEQVRVQQAEQNLGKKIDQAQSRANRAAAKQPPESVLDKWSR